MKPPNSLPELGRDGFHCVPSISEQKGDAVERVPATLMAATRIDRLHVGNSYLSRPSAVIAYMKTSAMVRMFCLLAFMVGTCIAQAQTLDLGDAPDTYRTLINSDGARHVFSKDLYLGSRVDSEREGQPSADALGDDINPSTADDEDGISFGGDLLQGENVNVIVTVLGTGRLDAWIDFNRDGDFADTGEHVLSAVSVTSGNRYFNVAVPINAKTGDSYARFRLSREGTKDYFGGAPDGEVEDYRVKIAVPPTDYGDAPDPTYPTLRSSKGASHRVSPPFNLGTAIDVEPDGQPHPNALGDLPDEDGVALLDSLLIGKDARVRIVLNPNSKVSGRIDAWVDWDLDGKWDPTTERVIHGQLAPGPNVFNVTVPATAKEGLTFARFRLSLEGTVGPAEASAELGEVEDYQVEVSTPPAELDWGDAPEAPYPTTLKNNGARHRINPDIFLGSRVDAETNGQPNATSTGDDINPTNANDEDGIKFLSDVIAGQRAKMEVQASIEGKLWVWIDFAADGDWLDAGELVFNGEPLTPGVNTLEFDVPKDAKPGPTFSRSRFSRSAVESFVGEVADGEVEDHPIEIKQPPPPLDYGDAPDPNYPTLFSNTGASHPTSPNYCLGKIVDAETNGQPNADATGDDANPTAVDDEDGVFFVDPLRAGQPAKTRVILTSATGARGQLDAWFDWDANGKWDDPGDHAIDTVLDPGPNDIVLNVPATAKPGQTFARFRLSQQGAVQAHSPSPELGEVEDYLVKIEAPATLDFGDAPDSYRTKLGSDGPRHTVVQRVCLGKLEDAEPDGQPSTDAMGDDIIPSVVDDEDGVAFLSPITAGGTAEFRVESSVAGLLSVWLDIDGSSTFAEPTDLLLNNVPLPGGPTNITVGIPGSAKPGESYMRFRFSREGVKTPHGPASDGEVEDYRVQIEEGTFDFGDAPEFDQGGYPTTLSHGGAYHRIVQRFLLGALVDGELNGQPSTGAVGDDVNPPRVDDEDGVLFNSAVVPGSPASVEVTAPSGGILDGWIDYDQNFSWNGTNEYVFKSIVLPSGTKTLSFTPPVSAKAGRTYTRFRLSRKGGLSPTGYGGDGEVEDHVIDIRRQPPCDLKCAGKEFWVTFPGNYAPYPANPVKPQLFIVGTPGTSVTAEAPGISYSLTTPIPATSCLHLSLPRSVDLGDANDVIEKKGVHIVATAPVSVHGLSQVEFTTDGFLALPIESLGIRHVVLAYANVHANVPELEGSQFALVATEPDTQVTIIPSVVTGVRDEGVPYHIKLQPGETYQLRSTSGAPADLTGTILLSDKPIAVFGSHQCANVQSLDSFFCDYLVEQLPPVGRWGAEYYTRPLLTRSGGDTVRILAAFNGTDVFINGAHATTLNRGQYFEDVLTDASQILATRPILVAQYANSSDFDGVANADPFMVLVPSRPTFNSQYRFCVPDIGFGAHYLNVIVPTAAIGTVMFDGAPVGVVWQQVGTSAYSHSSGLVASGVHTLTAAQPMSLIVYGWDLRESYGWPACFALGDLQPPVSRDTMSDVEIVAGQPGQSENPCMASVPDLRRQVTFVDDCGLSENQPIEQNPPPGTLVGVGAHSIVLSQTDLAGNVGRAKVMFVVVDPVPGGEITLDCPRSITALCDSREGAVVNFEAVAWYGCTAVPLICDPPSGTLFPRGVTHVICHTDDWENPLTCHFTVSVSCARLDIIKLADDKVLVDWSFEGTLQSAASLDGPWEPVEDTTRPYPVAPADRYRFFRVLEAP